MTVRMIVLEAGLASVQDLGRVGYERIGIAVNGAADQLAAKVANILVGNEAGAAHVEVVASDFAFSATAPLLISITGAPARVTVDGWARGMWEPLVLDAGQRLDVRGIHSGLRTYLAAAGSLPAPTVMGSCAPDSLLGTGRQLVAGDSVDVHTSFTGLDHPVFRHALFRFDVPLARYGTRWTVPVTAGPDLYEYDDALQHISGVSYRVGVQSNHIGLRLEGAVPQRSVLHEILSRGVPVGAVEAPPTGGLLVLLRGRHVTAGYPVLAVATHAGRRALGQAASGHIVTFEPVSLEQAIAAHEHEREQLIRLAARVRNAFGALGIPHTATHDAAPLLQPPSERTCA